MLFNFQGEICKCDTTEDKFEILISNLKLDDRIPKTTYINVFHAAINRLKATNEYNPNVGKLKSKASLFLPTLMSVQQEAKDYELEQYFDQSIDVMVIII